MQELSPRKPDWLKVKLPRHGRYAEVEAKLIGLNTVCSSAYCPNISECWGAGCCTFMILGNTCTRACRFCAVNHGRAGVPVDTSEPARLATAAREMGLNYIVITSVDRDDLYDGGAGHYAECIKAVKDEIPSCRVEAIIPDFSGYPDFLQTVVEAGPDVLAHNVEVVERLTPEIRDHRASYQQSLAVLREIKRLEPAIISKSSIMIGLGEEPDELKSTMRDIRAAGVDVLTIGQYLRHSPGQAPVERYVPPEEFDEFASYARTLGFSYVAAGPFVRTSYHAADYFDFIAAGRATSGRQIPL